MPVNTSFLKKLVVEDFDQRYQALVSKIAFVLNPAIDQLTNIFNNGLTIEDLNVQVKTVTLQVDSKGNPINPVSFASTLSGKCSMMQVGRAQNTTNSATYPTSGVLVSFSLNGTQIVINNVTGLTSGDTWQLTLIAYV